MNIRRQMTASWMLCLLVMISMAPLAQAATTEIGSYKFDAVYSDGSQKLTVTLANTSGRNRDAMKCFSLRGTTNGQFNILTRPGSGWYFPDHVSACGVFDSHAIHTGSFVFSVDPSMQLSDSLNIGWIDRDGHRFTATIAVSGNATANLPPVANAGTSRVVTDSDGFPGEQVLLDGSQSSDDVGIVLYAWYVDNILVANGIRASISLETDSVTTIELLVQDEEGLQNRDYVSITISEPNFSYNGVTPPPQYQLAYNNIAIYQPEQQMIYLCINITEGESENSASNEEQYNLNLRLSTTSPDEFVIDSYSPFNQHHLLNEFGEEPDCSGQYDAATGQIVDVVQVGSVVGSVSMQIENSPLPIIRVLDFELLSFGQE